MKETPVRWVMFVIGVGVGALVLGFAASRDIDRLKRRQSTPVEKPDIRRFDDKDTGAHCYYIATGNPQLSCVIPSDSVRR